MSSFCGTRGPEEERDSAGAEEFRQKQAGGGVRLGGAPAQHPVVPENWQRALQGIPLLEERMVWGPGVLATSSPGWLALLPWQKLFLFCSFTFKMAAHLLVATSFPTPGSS